MGFYNLPEEMYKARADRYKKEGDAHWAKAKNGGGDYHYDKAKKCYKEAEKNKAKAEEAKCSSFEKNKRVIS